jgi:hypothetical protein
LELVGGGGGIREPEEGNRLARSNINLASIREGRVSPTKAGYEIAQGANEMI